MHEECRGLSTLPPGSVPSIGGAFQQLGMAMGGLSEGGTFRAKRDVRRAKLQAVTYFGHLRCVKV